MFKVLDTLTGELPPTSTYSRRSWTWVPADSDSPDWDGRSGDLTIILAKSRRPGAKLEVDRYAVEEVQNLFAGGRKFLLLNLTDDEQSDVYEVFVGGSAGPRCSCKAANCKLECKHPAALAAVVEAGGLSEPIICGV